VAIHLTKSEREYLERLATRKIRPTKRQKALALLDLAAGKSTVAVSQKVGISKEELASIVDIFTRSGLGGLDLQPLHNDRPTGMSRRRVATIEKTPGVCGGTARIAGTRIPVWQLVEARRLGATEAQLLTDYPRLKAIDLVDAWAYAEEHPGEIEAAVHANEVA
jgi:uncharacterized protein (DUF433 family)